MTDSDRIVIPAETTVAILAVVVGLLTLSTLPVGAFYDDGIYVILAKALATGQGYHYLNLPGAPAGLHYPPGYPLVLALLWKLGPDFPANLIWFKVLNVALLGVIAWTTCRYAVRILVFTPGVAFLATLLGTLTIPMLVLTAMVVSEPLFLALAIPALILGEEMARQRPTRRQAIWLGVLTGVVVLVRSIGIMLPIAVVVVWCARKHWKAAAWYAGATLFIMSPWLVWTWAHAGELPPPLRGSYGPYSAWFLDGLAAGGLPFVVATVRTNLHTLGIGVVTSFRVSAGSVWTALTMVALVVLWLWGAWRIRTRAPVTLIFLALYLGLVFAWPYQPLRFVWGVWPLLMCVLLVPLEVVQVAESPRPLRIGAGVLLLLLVPGVLLYNGRGYHRSWWESIPRSLAERSESVIRWVRVHTKPSDVVAVESEPAIYLYTNRRVVPMATFTAVQYLRDRQPAENAGFLRQIINDEGVKYVVIQSVEGLAAARLLAADTTHPPYLVPVDSTAVLYAMKVTPTRPVPQAPALPGSAPAADSASR